MSTATDTPPATGPDDEPTAPVSLTKEHDQEPEAGDGDQAPDEDSRGVGSSLKDRITAAFAADGPVRQHMDRARENTWNWIQTRDLSDGQVAQLVIADRQRSHQGRETQLKQEISRIGGQIIAAKRTETADHEHNDPHRDGPQVIALKDRRELLQTLLKEHQALIPELAAEVTEGQVDRARWAKKASRAAMLVAGVIGGGVVLPMQDIRLLLLSLPAAAVALWRSGLAVQDSGEAADGEPTAGQVLQQSRTVCRDELAEVPVEGPGFAAAVTAARQAAETAGTPGSAAAQQVAAAAEQAAQVQGAADLITALVKAGIITKAEEEETRLVGVIRPDGPGWTATVELPAGKTAESAIGKAGELASALRVKTARIQLSKDVTEEGHEGRLVLWVASQDNPYAGPKIASELIAAESWDFWQQGVPLGTNARGVRKILNMLWSSLLIGGLMGYGKSYLARLIAAAAVLDPYLKIVLLCGKSGADWAALKLVAHAYVSGNTTSVIREMHSVMEDTIAEMAEHGQRLEQLFETDPKSCPEGKITPDLAKEPGLEMTLLLVDELQEILDAAAGMKLIPTDESAEIAEDGKKGPAGQNGKTVMVSLFARFMRVARFVGGMAVIVTQRPDSTSVPTELREVASKRACYRVKGQNSSRMVLGDDAVAAGAAPHLLMDAHKGVTVLDEGAEEGHDTLKAEVINLDQFRIICERGRDLRLKAGTLTGHAAVRWEKEREEVQRRQVVADAVAAMDYQKVDRARLVVLAGWMAEHSPERWHDLTETTLGTRLRDAGAGTTQRIGAVDGLTKASGYTREQLAALLDTKAA
ncbi:hypothetical protein [Kitasatospora sp. GP82]|uniref:hypothetical protein n=1 Tax=Kitasatospora sp. GP82 TaxID=3035089 RepID=UPI0024749B97|nr:hypothetical protein [Kitasatospora sp. GP82]MDH6125943.1 hypothetical protein [Kitasatospora sp. GP82]